MAKPPQDSRLNPKKTLAGRLVVLAVVLYFVGVGPVVALALKEHWLAPVAMTVYKPLLARDLRGFVRPYIFWWADKLDVPKQEDERPHS